MISPLLSRSLLLTLEPLTDDDLGMLVDRAVADPRGLGGARRRSAPRRGPRSSGSPRATPAARSRRSRRRHPSPSPCRTSRRRRTRRTHDARRDHRRARRAAPSTARCCATTGRATSTTTSSARSSSRCAARDVDAALHYLARMIEAGEDPRFIARRIIISAAEDIGLADPQALGDRRGGGRRRAVHRHAGGAHPARRGGRATSRPRRSRTPRTSAIDAAIADVRAGRIGRVPEAPARRALPGREATRPRQGLRLPARRPRSAWSRSSTCPTSCAARRYYEPTEHGNERDVPARLDEDPPHPRAATADGGAGAARGRDSLSGGLNRSRSAVCGHHRLTGTTCSRSAPACASDTAGAAIRP